MSRRVPCQESLRITGSDCSGGLSLVPEPEPEFRTISGLGLDRCPELVLCQKVDQLQPEGFCGRYIEIFGKPDSIVLYCQDTGIVILGEVHGYRAGRTPGDFAAEGGRECILEGVGQELIDDQSSGVARERSSVIPWAFTTTFTDFSDS